MTPLHRPLLFLAFALSLGSCSLLERDTEPRGMTDSGFRLTRVMWSNGNVAQFEYDGDNRIQRINYGRGSNTTGEISSLADYFEYKYQRGRCFRVYYRCLCDSDASYTDYLYNDRGQVDRRLDRKPNGDFAGMSAYRYDGSGHLVEARDSNLSGVTERLFAYDADDNLSSVARYRYRPYGVRKDRLEWRSYDSMRSYLQIPAMPLDDPNLERLSATITWTGHNFVTERRYFEVADDQPLRDFSDRWRSFVYNANGLPSRMISNGIELKFLYEKY